jgi:hypothetical protein
MEIRTLGRTHLAVSRIAAGLAALGRPGVINLGHATDLRSDFDVAATETRAQRFVWSWSSGRISGELA